MLLKAMQVLIVFEILYSFNKEIQLKDIESKIKNKLKKLLTELRIFKFMTILNLVLTKRESEDKTKYDTFFQTQKQK